MCSSDELKTPQSCLSPDIILEFFRESRQVSDDNINNKLNQIPCPRIVQDVYNEWKRRDEVLDYCSQFKPSANPTPHSNQFNIQQISETSKDNIQFTKTKSDPRLDAYKARDEISASIDDTNWIDTERMKEEIIRDNTIKLIKSKCGRKVPNYAGNPAP